MIPTWSKYYNNKADSLSNLAWKKECSGAFAAGDVWVHQRERTWMKWIWQITYIPLTEGKAFSHHESLRAVCLGMIYARFAQLFMDDELSLFACEGYLETTRQVLTQMGGVNSMEFEHLMNQRTIDREVNSIFNAIKMHYLEHESDKHHWIYDIMEDLISTCRSDGDPTWRTIWEHRIIDLQVEQEKPGWLDEEENIAHARVYEWIIGGMKLELN